MIVISHRGNINGPNHETENNPNHINKLLDVGQQVEIDVRYYNNKWYLGHEVIEYNVDLDFLSKPGLWIHAKDLQTAYVIQNIGVHYFSHNEDPFAITSKKYLWVHPKIDLAKCHNFCLDKVVAVLPINTELSILKRCYGICVDDINKYK